MQGALMVGFSRGRGFWNVLLARAITFFTGGRVSHSFLLYRDEHLGWMTLGANANGVVYMPLAEFLKSHVIVTLYAPRIGSLWTGLAKLKDDIDRRYNLAGILGEIPVTIARRWFYDKKARNIFDDPDRLYCSEFTTDVIRATPLPLLGTIDADTIDPAMEEAAIRHDDRNWIATQMPA